MVRDDVERIVGQMPGRTATELARALYGADGYQERINPVLRGLCATGRVRRQGGGGPGDPYRYFPVAARPRAKASGQAPGHAPGYGDKPQQGQDYV